VFTGIDTAAAQLILLARNHVDFNPSRGLIFGHQKNYIGPILKRDIRNHLKATKAALALEYTDGFFSAAGIPKLDVLDISDYEGANVIQDLNLNINQGLEKIKSLCLPGGYVLTLSPANNWLGHGFCQFSPELLFRNCDETQGWEVKAMYIVRKSLVRAAWYEFPDPKVKERRGNLHSRGLTCVGVIARKRMEKDSIDPVQQSDYELAWDASNIGRLGSIHSGLLYFLRLILAVNLRVTLMRC
jgi:hypothetical protein